MISLNTYLYISSILFVLGLIAVLSRKNAVAILMGIELILNAANINLVAFNHFGGGNLSGQVFAVFVMVLAAAEAAVALAIILNIYYRHSSINVDNISKLRG